MALASHHVPKPVGRKPTKCTSKRKGLAHQSVRKLTGYLDDTNSDNNIQGTSSTPRKSPTKKSSAKKRKKRGTKNKDREDLRPFCLKWLHSTRAYMCYGCDKAFRPNSDDLPPPPFNVVARCGKSL